MGNEFINTDEVHIWSSFLLQETNDLETKLKCLEPKEQDRALSFYFTNDMIRFVQRRYLLKSILAMYLQMEIKDIRLKYNDFGKPELLENKNDLYFNISHTIDLIVLAFSRNNELGVDIEVVEKDDVDLMINKDIFTDKEMSYFSNLDFQRKKELFYKLWTKKEAYLKAIGTGISKSLNSIEIEFINTWEAKVIDQEKSFNQNHYLIQLSKLPAKYIGMLALPKPPKQISYLIA